MVFSIDEGLLYPAHGLLQNSNLTRVSWVKAWEDGQWDGLDLSLQHVLPFDVLCQPVQRARPKKRGELYRQGRGSLGGAPWEKEKEQQQSIHWSNQNPKGPRNPLRRAWQGLG